MCCKQLFAVEAYALQDVQSDSDVVRCRNLAVTVCIAFDYNGVFFTADNDFGSRADQAVFRAVYNNVLTKRFLQLFNSRTGFYAV